MTKSRLDFVLNDNKKRENNSFTKGPLVYFLSFTQCTTYLQSEGNSVQALLIQRGIKKG